MKIIRYVTSAAVLACAALLVPGHCVAQSSSPTPQSRQAASPTPTPPPNSGNSIWTQGVTGFRKEHGAIGGYKDKKKWDLSDLPHYVPKQQLTGTIPILGNNYLADGELGREWGAEGKKREPRITLG